MMIGITELEKELVNDIITNLHSLRSNCLGNCNFSL